MPPETAPIPRPTPRPDPQGSPPLAALTVMVSAGEASGDAHAAHALAALVARRPGTTSFGMGAGALEAGGTELLVDCRDLAVIGFVDVLRNYPRFLVRLARLRAALARRRPDVLLICDYPDFNLKLAGTARAHGVPTLMYVAPQVWAWRAGRVPRIASLVDHLAVLFPFETRIWREAGVPVTCVGHPALRAIDPSTDPSLGPGAARAALGLDAAGAGGGPAPPTLALLPGSRPGELRRHLGPMLDAFERLARGRPGLRAVLPVAPTLDRADVEAAADAALPAALRERLHVIDGRSALASAAADVAIVASGTATLETALVGTPMIVIYRTHALNAAIIGRLAAIDRVALPNIVAGRDVVPELLQGRATGPEIARAAGALLDDPAAAAAARAALGEVRAALGEPGDAAAAVAGILGTLADERSGERGEGRFGGRADG